MVTPNQQGILRLITALFVSQRCSQNVTPFSDVIALLGLWTTEKLAAIKGGGKGGRKARIKFAGRYYYI